MAIPKSELDILKDLLKLFKTMGSEEEGKFYELGAKNCVECLAAKYGESETMIWCMFINLVKDGRIKTREDQFRIQKNILAVLEEGDDYLYTRLHFLNPK